MPPLEKGLWSSLWKEKTPPKLRHFLWRILSGALAVKQQLRSRCIQIDPICSLCGEEPQSICHMLFHCPRAKEVWSLSNFPLPPTGFSRTSTFLNLHYLFMTSRNKSLQPRIRLAFPWILWHIWKARNILAFEKVHFSAGEILEKALAEAAVWLKLHNAESSTGTALSASSPRQERWIKPPDSFVKCNVGCSWSAASSSCGSSWIVRDSNGNALCHSRRMFSRIYSASQAALATYSWAVEAMTDLKFQRLIFEFSSKELSNILLKGSPITEVRFQVQNIRNLFHSFEIGTESYVPERCSSIALEISKSVIRDNRQQSYVAHQGPAWLHDRIQCEASLST